MICPNLASKIGIMREESFIEFISTVDTFVYAVGEDHAQDAIAVENLSLRPYGFSNSRRFTSFEGYFIEALNTGQEIFEKFVTCHALPYFIYIV